MRPRSALAPLFLALITCVAAARPARAGYDKPPQNVLDVLHAPAPPRRCEPDGRPDSPRVVGPYPPMAQVAEPYLKLAGVRVEPRTRRKHDTPGGYGVAPCAQTLSVVDIATRRETPIALPPDGCADGFTWAADGGGSRSATPRRTPSSSGSDAVTARRTASEPCGSIRCWAARTSGCPTTRRSWSSSFRGIGAPPAAAEGAEETAHSGDRRAAASSAPMRRATR